jgi:hypothetical protein
MATSNLADFKVKNGLVVNTTATFLSTVNSTSTTTGGAIHVGGVAIAKDLWVGGNINVRSTSSATSTTTGALQVVGGVGIQGDLYARNLYSNGILIGTNAGSASTATNLAGGSQYQIPYQSTSSSTVFILPPPTGQNSLLQFTVGSGFTWTSTSSVGGGTFFYNPIVDTFTSAGTTTTFALSTTPTSKNILTVVVDGVTQLQSAFSLSGTSLIFSEIPYNGANIDVHYANVFSTSSGIVAAPAGLSGQFQYNWNGVSSGTTLMSYNTSSGVVSITGTTAATSTTTGALTVVGGVGIGGDIWAGNIFTGPAQYIYFGGQTGTRIYRDGGLNGMSLQTNNISRMFIADNSGSVTVTTTTNATSTSTGAFQVAGGVGIGGNLYVGGDIVANKLTIQLTTVTTTLVTTDDIISTYNTTPTNSTNTGALQIGGGAGIAGGLFVAGITTVTNTLNAAFMNVTNQGTVSQPAFTFGATNRGIYNPSGGDLGFVAAGYLQLYIAGTNPAVNYLQIAGGATGAPVTLTATGTDSIVNLSLAPKNKGAVIVSSTSATNSTNTGALQIGGGVGVAGGGFFNGIVTATNMFSGGSQVVTAASLGSYGVSSIAAGTDTVVSTSTGAVTIWDNSTLQSVTNRGAVTTNQLNLNNGVNFGSTANSPISMNANYTGQFASFISATGTMVGTTTTTQLYAFNYQHNLAPVTTATISSYYGQLFLPTLSNTATYGSMYGAFARIDMAAAATSGTVGTWIGFTSETPTRNAAADVRFTNHFGFRAQDPSSITATNVYGFTSQIASATGVNKWNIYASGTAPNYLAGSLGIGTTSFAAGQALAVTGGQTVTGIFTSTNTTNASSTNSGALQIGGGIGVAGGAVFGGIVTATTFVGNLTGTATNATTATNLAGGTAGQFAYQTAPGVTAFVSTVSMYVNRATIADSAAGSSAQVNTIAQPASANYYPTFVDSNNASSTAETVYTTSSFFVNPSTGAINATTHIAIDSTLLPNASAGVQVQNGSTSMNFIAYAGGGNYNPTTQAGDSLLYWRGAGQGNSGGLNIAPWSTTATGIRIALNGVTTIASTVSTFSTTTGALVVNGGVGIAGGLVVGGTVTATNMILNGYQVSTSSALTIQGYGTSLGTASTLNFSTGTTATVVGGVATIQALGSVSSIIGGTDTVATSAGGAVTIWNTSTLQSITNRGSTTTNAINITNATAGSSTTTGALVVAGGIGIGGNFYTAGVQRITNGTAATSTTTGALVVTGGVGIGGSLYAGNIYANGSQVIPLSIQEFTATAGQTTFTITGGYTVGTVQLFANGINLGSGDFTASNGTTVVVNIARSAGDIIRVISGGPSTAVNNIKNFSVAMSVAMAM